MKKITRALSMLLAVMLLLGATAFAAGGDSNPTVAAYNGEAGVTAKFDNTYSMLDVTYENAKIAKDGQYMIFVVTKNEGGQYIPGKDTIIYINQEQASAEDTISFSKVYPKTVTNSAIMISGTGFDAPKVIAEITVPGVTVSGTALSWNDTNDAVYLLYDAEIEDSVIKSEWQEGNYITAGNVIKTANKGDVSEAEVDGNDMYGQEFSFDAVEAGDYKVVILKPGKYAPKIIEITVDGTEVGLGQQKLWLYGDVYVDSEVDVSDAFEIQKYNAYYDSEFDIGTAQDKADRMAAADVYSDGEIDVSDAFEIQKYNAYYDSEFDNMR